MGNSDSKSKKKSKGNKDDGKDDGCIGNRKVRTIILAALLVAFMVFVAAYWHYLQDLYSEFKKACDDLPVPDPTGFCDEIDDYYYSTTLAFSGVFIVIVGAIAAALLFLVSVEILGKIAAFILLVGGILYLIGGIWFFSKGYNDEAEADDTGNAIVMGWIGEVILGGAAALMLGLDAAFGCYENEFNRIQSNLSMLFVVGMLCMGSYYSQICDPDALICVQRDGVEAIATGWLIIVITALVYMILMLLKCLSCGLCECLVDNKCTRFVVAIALVIGGLLTAIGYWIYAGNFGELSTDGDDVSSKAVAYYIGVSILVG
eukprot:782423_1